MAHMRHTLSQIVAVVGVNLRTIPRRAGASAVAIIGIAGVVIVLVSVLSIAHGFRATMTAAGDPRIALVMRSGSRDEMSSTMLREQVQIVKNAPGVLQGPDGPLASAEFLAMVSLPKRSTGTDANVVLRGVEPEAFIVRSGVRIAEGRDFQPGRYEIVAGRAALRQFAGVDLGQSVRWGSDTWTVVGVLEAGGGIAESEIWCGVGVLQSAFHRHAIFRSLRVTLESPESFGRFKGRVDI
jgi:putative ABC transport system permease protein